MNLLSIFIVFKEPSIFSIILDVYYCKFCILISYSAPYLFLNRSILKGASHGWTDGRMLRIASSIAFLFNNCSCLRFSHSAEASRVFAWMITYKFKNVALHLVGIYFLEFHKVFIPSPYDRDILGGKDIFIASMYTSRLRPCTIQF